MIFARASLPLSLFYLLPFSWGALVVVPMSYSMKTTPRSLNGLVTLFPLRFSPPMWPPECSVFREVDALDNSSVSAASRLRLARNGPFFEHPASCPDLP